MPQLDHTTFISQVFWLGCSFGFLYLISVQYLLPRIYNNLKVRQKELQHAQLEAALLAKEQSSLIDSYDNSVKESFEKSRKLIAESLSTGTNWINNNILNIERTQLLDGNQVYLTSISHIITIRQLLHKIYDAS